MKKQMLTTMEQVILDKYGPSLTTAQVAEAIGYSIASVYCYLSRETFEIPMSGTRKKRRADFREVARYLDARRQQAA